MLRISGSSPRCSADPSRRSFLQAGALGVAGLTLGDLLRSRAQAAAPPRDDASVILFWLSGGPGHMETWDPKPAAPAEYRGPFGACGTSVAGVELGELMPEQAGLMEHLAVLRTVNHGTGDHTKGNHWMLTGFEGPAFNAVDRAQRRPSLGSVAAALCGPGRPGLPAYVAAPHLRGGTDNLFHYASYLGAGCDPFSVEGDPNERGFRVRGLKTPDELSLERLESRREMLAALDRFRRRTDAGMVSLDEHNRQAFEMITGPQAREAFDISAEEDVARDRYGRHTFGQSALLARRLVERGVSFVTVNCVPWDHHGQPGQMKTEEGARQLVPPLDRAIAALVRDLMDRGLYERTLVVVMGEFGRTPRMNSLAGRDHWGDTFSVLMGCGGMRMGQVIGRSSARGEHVVDRPIDPQEVAATIYHHLGIDPSVTFPDRLGRPMPLLDRVRPIRELVS